MNVSSRSVQFRLPHQPEYDHIQTAPIYWLVLLTAAALFVGAVSTGREEPILMAVFLVSGVPVVLLAFSFQHLRIRDEGQELAVHFGPLPVFKARFAYSDLDWRSTSRLTGDNYDPFSRKMHMASADKFSAHPRSC